jgi:predicted PurR-regulated permease PerM
MGIWRGRRDRVEASSTTVQSSTTAQPVATSVRPNPSPRVVWRSGLVLLGVVALGAFGWFVLNDAGSALFTILMAWFAAVTMEPAIRRLTPRLSRGQAALLVMGLVAAFLAVFVLAFGRLLLDQIAQLLRGLPGLVEDVVGWVNRTFSTSYSTDEVLEATKLTADRTGEYANEVLAAGVSLLGWTAGAFFSAFTAVFLIYYLAADGPRLRVWVARLLPERWQRIFTTTWDLTTIKTGGYVSARVVLATINGGTSALVFLLIGMPSWLALGIWTGVVAQFVPTIGTYISIILPVLVGLLSPNPWIGVAALVWAIVYQQVENLTIEPRISAKAVDVHPAVGFASVMIGSALFGVAGALLSIPVVAVLLALTDIYARRHELLPELRTRQAEVQPPPADPPPPRRRRFDGRRSFRRRGAAASGESPAPASARGMGVSPSA